MPLPLRSQNRLAGQAYGSAPKPGLSTNTGIFSAPASAQGARLGRSSGGGGGGGGGGGTGGGGGRSTTPSAGPGVGWGKGPGASGLGVGYGSDKGLRGYAGPGGITDRIKEGNELWGRTHGKGWTTDKPLVRMGYEPQLPYKAGEAAEKKGALTEMPEKPAAPLTLEEQYQKAMQEHEAGWADKEAMGQKYLAAMGRKADTMNALMGRGMGGGYAGMQRQAFMQGLDYIDKMRQEHEAVGQGILSDWLNKQFAREERQAGQEFEAAQQAAANAGLPPDFDFGMLQKMSQEQAVNFLMRFYNMSGADATVLYNAANAMNKPDPQKEDTSDEDAKAANENRLDQYERASGKKVPRP